MDDVTIGIDIGGTNTLIGSVTKEGKILKQDRILTTDYPDIDDFVKKIKEVCGKLVLGNLSSLKAIGVGVPNGNYLTGTIESAVNLAWKGDVPLASKLENAISVPCLLTNDANAAAVGEMMFGGAKEMKNFIVITLGTGLGSGIVVDGKVLYGHTGMAAEMGHVIMVPGGRECGCGRLGCLETYVSATGIVRTVQWMLSESKELSPLRNIHPKELTSRLISEAASQGDSIALEAFNYTAEILAYAIADAYVMFSPESVFLFGGMTKSGDLLFEPVRKYTNDFVFPSYRGKTRIVKSEIDENNAAVLGSAALAWNEVNR